MRHNRRTTLHHNLPILVSDSSLCQALREEAGRVLPMLVFVIALPIHTLIRLLRKRCRTTLQSQLTITSIGGYGRFAKSNYFVSAKYFVNIGPLIVESSPGANVSMVEEMPSRSRILHPSSAVRLRYAT